MHYLINRQNNKINSKSCIYDPLIVTDKYTWQIKNFDQGKINNKIYVPTGYEILLYKSSNFFILFSSTVDYSNILF